METYASRFIFRGYILHERTSTIDFRYTIEHAHNTVDFVEKLTLADVSLPSKDSSNILLNRILEQIHLLLGISYWKLYCLQDINTVPLTLTKDQAQFWNIVYTKGLGEFYYKNQIDFRGLVRFPYDENAASDPIATGMTDQSLVQLGGGKDSIVTAELLKKHAKDFTLVCVDDRLVHHVIAKRIGKPLICVKRTIDARLFELNRLPGTYNGHIPISAIYAFVDLLVASLGGYRYIVASNEESANYGNVTYLGEEINHQWSKSLEFEILFQDYVRRFVTPDITYFSLLRPLREVKIMELFSRYGQYFDGFTSCNTNFRIDGRDSGKVWCGNCPKCAFVFLLLSAFIPKKKLIAIFGRNLYMDSSLAQTFRELLGLVGIKPFECVGTPEESRYALYRASQTGEYEAEPLFVTLRNELKDQWENITSTEQNLFVASSHHRIPEVFQNILKHI